VAGRTRIFGRAYFSHGLLEPTTGGLKYLWREGEFASIDFPDASLTITRGINSEGDIVGQYTTAGVTHGFLLSGDKRDDD
jgi:hypothetical protein